MEDLTRRQFVGRCSSLVAAAAAEVGSPAVRRPNIIVILGDDLGYGDLGCFGQKVIRTPNIDRLAGAGTRFTHCYSGSTVCAPSRSCLITGQHTGHTRVRGNDYVPLRPEDPSLGSLFQKAGYRTAIIGKWGLGEPGTTGVPSRQGFDEFYGYLNQVHAHDSYPTMLCRGDREEPIPQNEAGKQGAYSNDLFLRESLGFIERNRTRPFFLMFCHTIPHAFPAKKTIEVPEIEPEYRDKPWPEIEKRYASAVTRHDRHVGRLMARLKELGIEDDTLVIFTSDNGPQTVTPHDPEFFQSRGGLRGIKRDLYEGGIRVPTIVRWPGKVKAGAASATPWAFWDILPSSAELLGRPAPRGMDGVSVLPVWLGRAARPHPAFYWEFHERGFEQAVRMGDWKAVRHSLRGPLELYDLRSDPKEAVDVSAKHRDVTARIETYLATARSGSAEFPIREKP